MNRNSEKAVNDAIKALTDTIIESEDIEICRNSANIIATLQQSLRSSAESRHYYGK